MVTLKRPPPKPPIPRCLKKEGPANRENGTSDSKNPKHQETRMHEKESKQALTQTMSRLRANQAAMLAEYSHSDSLQPDEPRPGRDGGQNEQTKARAELCQTIGKTSQGFRRSSYIQLVSITCPTPESLNKVVWDTVASRDSRCSDAEAVAGKIAWNPS